jgi:hypothetical protein
MRRRQVVVVVLALGVGTGEIRTSPVPDAGLDPLFSKVGEAVLGGGYYFVPPLEHKTRPWTWILPEA